MAEVEVITDPRPPVRAVVLTLTPKEAIRAAEILGKAGGETAGGEAIPNSLGVYGALHDALQDHGLVPR